MTVEPNHTLRGALRLDSFEQAIRHALPAKVLRDTQVGNTDAVRILGEKQVSDEIAIISSGTQHRSAFKMTVKSLAWQKAKRPAVLLHQSIKLVEVRPGQR